MKSILLTGGMGYIGSHICVELLKEDYKVVIVDNLSNSDIRIKEKIEEISKKKVIFYKFDIREEASLKRVFEDEKIDCVIHLAGFKSVSDSVKNPIEYYENNIGSTISLVKVMEEVGVRNIIFSSSASVYGDNQISPIDEKCNKQKASSPYGNTKNIIEDILMDMYIKDKSWNIVLLRYFNPVGAHKSGLIGEIPNGIPNNLMPYISKVANGEIKFVKIFGNDYETKDGTGVRDYIHVVDLAKGHVKAIKKLKGKCGVKIYNLGTGQGYSVIEVIKAFEKASSKKIEYVIEPRRDGDIAICFANPTLAKQELGWEAKLDINQMCEDFWRWQCTGLQSLKKI